MKMVFRPLMVGNDLLFGRGICVEQMAIQSVESLSHGTALDEPPRGHQGRTAGAITANVGKEPAGSIVTARAPARVRAAAHHSGLLRFCVNEENIMLKLILILSLSLLLASTECCR